LLISLECKQIGTLGRTRARFMPDPKNKNCIQTMAFKNSLDATQILPLTRLDHCCAQSDDETRIQFCIQRLMSFDKLNQPTKKTTRKLVKSYSIIRRKCKHGDIAQVDSACVCKCHSGYSGKYCKKRIKNRRKIKGVKECVNGNTVAKARKSRKMKLKCQCLNGWRGKKCNVKIKNMNRYRVETIPPDVLADVDHHVNLNQAQFIHPTKPPVKKTEIQKKNNFEQNAEDIKKEFQHDTLIIRPPVVMRTFESPKRTKVVNQMTASFDISRVKPTPEGAGIRSNDYIGQAVMDSHRRANFEAEGSSFKPLVNRHQRLYKENNEFQHECASKSNLIFSQCWKILRDELGQFVKQLVPCQVNCSPMSPTSELSPSKLKSHDSTTLAPDVLIVEKIDMEYLSKIVDQDSEDSSSVDFAGDYPTNQPPCDENNCIIVTAPDVTKRTTTSTTPPKTTSTKIFTLTSTSTTTTTTTTLSTTKSTTTTATTSTTTTTTTTTRTTTTVATTTSTTSTTSTQRSTTSTTTTLTTLPMTSSSSIPKTLRKQINHNTAYDTSLDDVIDSQHIHYEMATLPKTRTVPFNPPTPTPQTTIKQALKSHGEWQNLNYLMKTRRYSEDYCRHGRPEIKKNSKSGEKWLRCKCSEGYFGHQCNRRVNHCADYYQTNHERACEHSCRSLPTKYECYCANGYQLEANGRDCSLGNDFYKLLMGKKSSREESSYKPAQTQKSTSSYSDSYRRSSSGFRRPNKNSYPYRNSNSYYQQNRGYRGRGQQNQGWRSNQRTVDDQYQNQGYGRRWNNSRSNKREYYRQRTSSGKVFLTSRQIY